MVSVIIICIALVLVLLCNTLGVQASTKKDDPTVIVKDYGSLYTAIAEAKDNDVIGIQGTITIPAIVDLNMSENKAVILRRMEAGAKLVVSGDYGADNKASFRMISFDGNSTEVGGTEPFVEINENAYFSMFLFYYDEEVKKIYELPPQKRGAELRKLANRIKEDYKTGRIAV